MRACLALACAFGGPPVATSALSREHNIPQRYLEQILSTLRRCGLVQATRGPKGGYQLLNEPSTTTVADVVRAVEGEMPPVLCSMPELRSENCRTHSGCVSRDLCFDLESTLMGVLDGTTLEDLRQKTLGNMPNEGTVPVSKILQLQRNSVTK